MGFEVGKTVTDSVHSCVRLCGREELSVTVRTECTGALIRP